MAAVGKSPNSSYVHFSDSPQEGRVELPHLHLRVGEGLRVSIRTSGSPTPPCTTESLRSHSTKLLLDSRERPKPPLKRYSSAQLARSTSQLASECHMFPVNDKLGHVHCPTHLSTCEDKRALQVSGVSWSTSTSADHSADTKSTSQEEPSESVNRGSSYHQSSKSQFHQRSFSFSCGRGERTKLLSRQQAQPTCRRRILTDYEKNLTFKPKLNNYSLKIASRNARHSVSVVNRLSEVQRNQLLPHYDKEHLTFAPKLNPLSLKLAHERASRASEVYTDANWLGADSLASIEVGTRNSKMGGGEFFYP